MSELINPGQAVGYYDGYIAPTYGTFFTSGLHSDTWPMP